MKGKNKILVTLLAISILLLLTCNDAPPKKDRDCYTLKLVCDGHTVDSASVKSHRPGWNVVHFTKCDGGEGSFRLGKGCTYVTVK